MFSCKFLGLYMTSCQLWGLGWVIQNGAKFRPYHHNDVIMSGVASQSTSITIVYSAVYSGTDQRKHQSSASQAFVRGIHRGPVNSPHKGLVTWKMFPFDDVIMFRSTSSAKPKLPKQCKIMTTERYLLFFYSFNMMMVLGAMTPMWRHCHAILPLSPTHETSIELWHSVLLLSSSQGHRKSTKISFNKDWYQIGMRVATDFSIKMLHTWPVWHDDDMKWKHFPRYWPFVRGIHRSPVNSSHKGQWRGALMFSLICVWINGWVNNRKAGDLRRYRVHYDVTVMKNGIILLSPIRSWPYTFFINCLH